MGCATGRFGAHLASTLRLFEENVVGCVGCRAIEDGSAAGSVALCGISNRARGRRIWGAHDSWAHTLLSRNALCVGKNCAKRSARAYLYALDEAQLYLLSAVSDLSLLLRWC